MFLRRRAGGAADRGKGRSYNIGRGPDVLRIRDTLKLKPDTMKKLILMAAVALMALPAAAQNAEAYPSYIQVTGRAEQELTPDEFYLSIVIDERDSKGKISVESQQRDLVSALRKQGVNVAEQLKMANLSSEFFKKKSSVATAKYQLKLSSAEEVARVWQALDALGISDVSLQRVTHSKLDQYKEQVRLDAIRNARESAESLAGAIGQTVGKCFYIYDSNSDVLPAYYNNGLMMARGLKVESDVAAESVEEPLEFKNIKLEYSVQAKFVLE